MGRNVRLRWRVRATVTTATAISLTLVATTPAWSDVSTAGTSAVVTGTGLTEGQLVPRDEIFFPTFSDDAGIAKVSAVLTGYTGGGACQLSTTRGWVCLVQTNHVPNDIDATITVTAVDTAGQSSSLSTTVHVDNVLPTGKLSPAPYTSIHSGPVVSTLTGVSADTTKIEVTDGPGGAVLVTEPVGPVSYSWTAAPGSPTPCFRLTDRAGNVGGACTAYIVDDDAPVIQRIVVSENGSSIGADAAGAWVGASTHLLPLVADASPIARYEWRVNGALESTDPLFAWDTSKIKTSAVTVRLAAWDAVGNTSSMSIPMNVDNTGPTVTVTPAQGKLIRGATFTTTVKATDPRGIEGTLLQGADGKPGQGSTVTLKSGKDGARTFTWQSVDKLDNQTTVKRTVIVDNTAPAVSIKTAPKDKAKVKATFTVAASASDHNGIVKVQLLVNGKVVATDSKAAYSFSVTPSKYGKTFTVQLRAYDKAGNLKLSSKRAYHR